MIQSVMPGSAKVASIISSYLCNIARIPRFNVFLDLISRLPAVFEKTQHMNDLNTRLPDLLHY
jgi:hypothetical protein